ncbi:ChrR family anti-sigma-E factor [Phaeovulum vinaykumarii]|uniref:Anti-ECFsigma factor, ChrR n=1 Tax=Phaeovulum vinaykumarii TaxID=407234 RepID=A0A1N7KYP1_9RHOB|nr:ChrR family anti-sigma-E factor [Phaeovulum vinaykumarii]SIS66705.1 anti-ECFsigma factor, ChrR [Phaeovulum vinaykumarii]SOC00998.1 ChrR-like anti-ECFsigma factor [Phaeovulum vinaykumarii]
MPLDLKSRGTAISHHPTDALMMEYAAGTLPEGFALVVATHISMCDECRARLHAFEAVGGALLDSAPTCEMGEGALARVMAGLDARPARSPAPVAPQSRPQPRPPARPRGLLPEPLAGYVGGGIGSVRWKPLGLGVRTAVIPTGGSATARLLYIPAGESVPDHGHRGRELTLVLQGAFADAEGRFGPGDIECAGTEVEHTPVAEPGQDCICLAATDALLRFRALIPRLAQPLFRI